VDNAAIFSSTPVCFNQIARNFMTRIMRRSIGVVVHLLSLMTRPVQLQRTEQELRLLAQDLKRLSLYDYKGCPASLKVHHTLYRLNLDIQYCDIRKCQIHSDFLLSQHGRLHAPSLRIENPDGVEWINDPDAIIEYLVARFDPQYAENVAA
jgi:glutaredoxin